MDEALKVIDIVGKSFSTITSGSGVFTAGINVVQGVLGIVKSILGLAPH